MTSTDLVKRWYQTREPSLFAENVEFNVCSTFPCAGNYCGREAVYQEFFAKLLPRFAEFRLEHDHFVDSGDQVFVIGRYVGRVREDDNEFSAPFTHIWTVSEQEIHRVDQHAETGVIDRAFAAVNAV